MKEFLSFIEELSLNNLVWLRPDILWALLFVIPVIMFSWVSDKKNNQWQKAIDKHLLQFMLQQGESSHSRMPLVGLMIALTIAIVALAGPSFTKQPIPVYRTDEARVILLDLSLSMNAVDIKPSRLTRAKHKLVDILDETKEGETALIVYAGDAFVISPLTSDANTIATMVPVLDTNIMPILGSDPALAFVKAKELLSNAGKQTGNIIWITDGVDDLEAEAVIEEIKGSGIQLSILTVATTDGAPIPLDDNKGFLKDSSGQIVMPSLQLKPLQDIVNSVDSTMIGITPNNADIEALLAKRPASVDDEFSENRDQVQEQLDQGYWLLFLLLPLVLVLFRKNASIPGLAVALIISLPMTDANASLWDDLWLTKDQQAAKALEQNDAARAASLFENKNWQASANYYADNHQAAENIFNQDSSADGLYNKGNALAKQGKYDDAIAAYNEALKKQPDMEDAIFNKELIEKLKQQQEQEQQDQKNQEQEQQEQQDQQQEQEQQDQQQEQNEQQQEQQSDQEQNQQQSDQQQKELNKEDLRNEQEKDQALEQWLRKIPDDPGGLLRRKMYREYKKRGRENRYRQKVW
ncbi:MAG: VWA domain-containing protein [Kangiellaceae bacterium]|jgi:Ca-activated chloride channel family protein|nr:VWA domain-containing protein [Kangiellaceae bacterium]